ncbi:MAG: rhomboid family intramembrane serine protease [Candidatus Pacebacteria bacterium]|nr:rhomboid family intramembrane serine protease [Candidatus Paceibacterota bacterium]
MIPLYDENRIKGKLPFVTIGLVLANVFFFFYTFQNIGHFAALFGFFPRDILDGRIFTIFTAMFLHADLLHLLGNMLFLWVFGENLESRIGPVRFFIFYLVCGFIAALVYALMSGASNIPVVGASGAISGILGGYLVLFPGNKIKSIVPLIIIWTLISIPALIFIIIWFLYQFVSLYFSNGSLVAYSAHVGGFLAGAILIKKFASRRKLI